MPKHLRVLMVEDSQDDAQLILHALAGAGFDLEHQVVQRGSDFMAALQAQEWDLVLSDFSMPEYSGADAYLALRESGIDVPFIFVSGHIGEERAAELMKLGASDYVLKDNLARLVPAVLRELRESAARRQHQVLADQLVRAEAGFKRL
ncbi:MAG TPA: response regulator, partial [bacterium]|nr:response regulator [bacterium]